MLLKNIAGNKDSMYEPVGEYEKNGQRGWIWLIVVLLVATVGGALWYFSLNNTGIDNHANDKFLAESNDDKTIDPDCVAACLKSCGSCYCCIGDQ